MARYIDRDRIYFHCHNYEYCEYGDCNGCNNCVITEKELNKIPIEDVTPIVRGKWEFDEKGYYCNKCGYRPFAGAYQFCAVCGADMRSMKESGEEE